MVLKLKEPMVHGCGKSFDQPNTYAMHAKHCDGTKPATSGRIAARDAERTRPAAKRPSVPREKKRRRKKREVALAVLLPPAKNVTPADFLGSLDAQIEKLQRVRAAVAEIA